MALTRIQTDAFAGAITTSNIADGTILPADINTSNDFTFNTIKIGKGNSAISTNTAVGVSALAANTTGDRNSAFGYTALAANTTGWNNAAFGRLALNANTTGDSNTACGSVSLYLNTTGTSNSALGYSALASNVSGSSNTAVGTNAMWSGTTASNNVVIGASAGYTLNSNNNTIIGYQAGFNLAGSAASSGYSNILIGHSAGYGLSTGFDNTIIGRSSATAGPVTGWGNVGMGARVFQQLQSGQANVAIGGYWDTVTYAALFNLTTGNANVALGTYALGGLVSGSQNVGVGYLSGSSITTGSKNVIIGSFTGNNGTLDIRTSSNNIVLSDGDGNVRMTVAPSGYTRIAQNASDYYTPSINATSYQFTNLSTTYQSMPLPSGPSGGGAAMILDFFLQDVNYDQATFTIWCGRQNAVSHRYWANSFGGNCSISETSEGVFDISGLGDGKTYTIAMGTGSPNPQIKASAATTGTTVVSLFIRAVPSNG